MFLKTVSKITSKGLRGCNINNEEFTLVINEQQNRFRLKGSIRAKEDQLSGIEQDRLIEHGKSIEQNESASLKIETDI